MKSKGTAKNHCVVDGVTAERTCFKTLPEAQKHLASLRGAPSKGKKKKAAGCGCGG
jgi:hypothetical protein